MEYNFPVTRTTHPKLRPADETKLGFAKYFTDHMFVMDYDEGQGWHDGRVVPHEPFLIEPASCVLHYAQMMFEGMKAYRTPVGGNYGGGMRASQDAMKYNCKDVLWLDAAEHKYVEEIGTSNAFFRIADEVITAPLDSGTILPGITRDSVIQLLKKWGVKVSERKLSIDEVVAASKDGSLQEIFASGTAAVISPIGWLNVMGTDVQVADGTVGPVAQKLYDTLYGMQTGTVADDMGWTYRLL